jgi:hypothetical protein
MAKKPKKGLLREELELSESLSDEEYNRRVDQYNKEVHEENEEIDRSNRRRRS